MHSSPTYGEGDKASPHHRAGSQGEKSTTPDAGITSRAIVRTGESSSLWSHQFQVPSSARHASPQERKERAVAPPNARSARRLMVEGSRRQHAARRALPPAFARSDRDLRRVHAWLGCLIRRSNARRALARHPLQPTHKLAGNGSGSPNDRTPGSRVEGKVCSLPHRQPNHGRVHNETGRHFVGRDDSPHETTAAAHEPSGHSLGRTPPRRGEERGSGPAVAKGRSVQERMEVGRSNVLMDPTSQPVRAGDGGSVREPTEPSASEIWVASPRRQCAARGLLELSMAAQRSAVCVPTGEHLGEGTGEDSGGARGLRATHRTDHSYDHVVSDTKESGPPLRTPATNVSAHATALRHCPPGLLVDAFGDVGNTGARLLNEGYTPAVLNRLHTARRTCTNLVYKSKWSKFVKYCRARGEEPTTAQAGLVTSFLNYLDVVERLAPATIRAYRAAIGHMTRTATGYNPGEDAICSQLVKSIERTATPTKQKIPQWDVSIVLRALLASDNSDEQLSRHIFTAKVTFLLALATGERRAGLHALSHEASVSMSAPPTLVLQHVAVFVPKAWFLRKNRFALPDIEVPCVEDAATEQICPVHTTIRYLELVKTLRTPAQTSLLIPHKPANPKNLAIQAIPRYIVRLVRWAYAYFGLDPPENVRGHDVRGSLRASQP